MGKNLFTAAQFIAAIPKTGGIITSIANKVGCTWNTAKSYINRHPTVLAAYRAECEVVLDMAESELIKALKRGDQWAVKYLLSTKGKARGYTEKTEIEIAGAGGGPIKHQEVRAEDLTDDELAAIASGRRTGAAAP